LRGVNGNEQTSRLRIEKHFMYGLQLEAYNRSRLYATT